MVLFIPVNYRNKKYPSPIVPKVKEVPAHFDSKESIPNCRYSLHTEYSYMPRKFDKNSVNGLNHIVSSADRSCVPILWSSVLWAKEFAEFIFRFVGSNHAPEVIEIHPPFDDYYEELTKFIEIYRYFENAILSKYPEAKILVENRCGSQHNPGNFLISSPESLLRLSDLIYRNNLRLKIALDFPQLFSSIHSGIGNFTDKELETVFEVIDPISEYVGGVHLWGKCYGKSNHVSAHMGTLDSYFYGIKCDGIDVSHFYSQIQTNPASGIKETFLHLMYSFLDDGKERYFVPEVNSKPEHLQIIVNDLLKTGFEFV